MKSTSSSRLARCRISRGTSESKPPKGPPNCTTPLLGLGSPLAGVCVIVAGLLIGLAITHLFLKLL